MKDLVLDLNVYSIYYDEDAPDTMFRISAFLAETKNGLIEKTYTESAPLWTIDVELDEDHAEDDMWCGLLDMPDWVTLAIQEGERLKDGVSHDGTVTTWVDWEGRWFATVRGELSARRALRDAGQAVLRRTESIIGEDALYREAPTFKVRPFSGGGLFILEEVKS